MQRQIRKTFFTVLNHTLNPVTRWIARSSFGPFGIIRHIGRRSGKVYETPIIVRPVKDGFVVELTYGRDVDWHKNVLAAGGCTVVWHRKEFAINEIEPLNPETGLVAFSRLQRFILRILKRKEFEKMMFQLPNQTNPEIRTEWPTT
jgi:deazaflavin-dependent oxidoreductase (nitroreductase family)